MANAILVRPLPFTVFASSTVLGGQVEYTSNDYAGVICRLDANSGSEAFLNIDLGADAEFDTVALFGLDDVPNTATWRITYATAAQGPFTGGTTPVPAGDVWAGSVLPVSGKVTSLLLTPSVIVARYVQIAINAGGAIDISRVVIGKRTALERNFGFGAAFGVRDLGSLDFNRLGVMSRIRGKKLRTVGLTFSSINRDEVEAITKPLLEQIGNTEMIALVTDPVADPQRQNRCYYGPLVGDLSHTWRNAKAWEAKANLVSIF